jgi:hypothetical protein
VKSRRPINSDVGQLSAYRMKISFTIILLTLCAAPSFAQVLLLNQPPRAFGPIKSITDKNRSVTFSRDKTRIDERLSNGRTIVWIFTAQGRLLTSEMFEKNGRPTGTKSDYKYDSAGLLRSIVRFRLGSLISTETLNYPEAHRTEITRVFEPNHSSDIEIHEYDDSGNITKATLQESAGTLTEFYKYDDKGNPTEFIAANGTKVIVKETYQYEFDTSGNWTKKKVTTSRASEPTPLKSTIERKIVYY